MASYLTSSLYFITDKLGDATIRVLDEFKFWGEVVTEFMEYDQSSSDKYFEEYRKQIREQIQEVEEAQQEVDQILQEQDEQNQEELEDELKNDDEKQL